MHEHIGARFVHCEIRRDGLYIQSLFVWWDTGMSEREESTVSVGRICWVVLSSISLNRHKMGHRTLSWPGGRKRLYGGIGTLTGAASLLPQILFPPLIHIELEPGHCLNNFARSRREKNWGQPQLQTVWTNLFKNP